MLQNQDYHMKVLIFNVTWISWFMKCTHYIVKDGEFSPENFRWSGNTEPSALSVGQLIGWLVTVYADRVVSFIPTGMKPLGLQPLARAVNDSYSWYKLSVLPAPGSVKCFTGCNLLIFIWILSEATGGMRHGRWITPSSQTFLWKQDSAR